MYILQEAQTPQGATCKAHRIDKLIVDASGATATLNSYANDSSTMIVWQDVHTVPMLTLGSGNYPQNVYEYLVSASGAFPSGTLMFEVDDLTKAKQVTKQSIVTLRDQHIAQGVTTPSGRVDTDPVSIRNIMATYQAAVLASVTSNPFSTDWRMSDNTSVTLSAAAVIGMGNAVLAHTKACYENSWTLKASVDAATDLAGVSTIDITSGWPTV